MLAGWRGAFSKGGAYLRGGFASSIYSASSFLKSPLLQSN